jgi:nitroimidazol reductase NimA-like FMN-containing flavoprotein (pyridoxamine 5'-phosphate oxidase superfamily)
MDLSMTPEQRLAFVRDTPRVGVLSIDAPNRGPVSNPVWYTVEADNSITFSVGDTSKKTELLRAAGRATLCVQSEAMPYSYVTMEGPVTEVGASTDEASRERAHRYLGAEFGELYFESTRAEPSLTFALSPQRWSSTDYAKLFG